MGVRRLRKTLTQLRQHSDHLRARASSNCLRSAAIRRAPSPSIVVRPAARIAQRCSASASRAQHSFDDLAVFHAIVQAERDAHSGSLERRSRLRVIVCQAQINGRHAVRREFVCRDAEGAERNLRNARITAKDLPRLRPPRRGRSGSGSCSAMSCERFMPAPTMNRMREVGVRREGTRGPQGEPGRIAAAHRHQNRHQWGRWIAARAICSAFQAMSIPNRCVAHTANSVQSSRKRLRHGRIVGDIGRQPAIGAIVDNC